MTLIQLQAESLTTAFFVITRVTTLFSTNPVFGHRAIPAMARITLGILTSFLIIPLVPPADSESITLSGFTIGLVSEFFLGLSIGLLITMMFSVAVVAGQSVSSAAGIHIASFFDATLKTPATVVVTLKTIILFLIFLSLDYHHIIIRSVAYSFRVLPPGHISIDYAIGPFLARLFSAIIETAFTMTVPALLVVLIVQLAMAIIARIAPQMNVFFSVGGILNISLALMVLTLSFPTIAAIFEGFMSTMDDHIMELFQYFGP